MNNNILISTITSCYKMKPYLKTFLEKLPEQTIFNNLEVILVHNEPDQEEIAWVNTFKSKYPFRIKHFFLDKVEPLGKSWNRCIQESSGKYLTIWNIDDLRTKNSLELQTNLLENNSKIDVVYGNYTVVDSFGKTEGKSVFHEQIPHSEFTRSMIWGPFFMFRKSLVEKAGYFDEQLTSGLDFDFAIRAALHSKAAMVSSSLGYYLNSQEGLSTRPNSQQPIERTAIELRYGIYDKIDYKYLPQATQYNIPFLKFHDTWNHVSQFVPNYNNFIQQQASKWHITGLKNNANNLRNSILQRSIHKIKHYCKTALE